jgi:hypothetical protein
MPTWSGVGFSVAVNESYLEEMRSLRAAVNRLEAERDCADVLSRYGFYSDHGRRDDWISLFTEDAVFDLMMYYGDDVVNSDPAEWKRTRFVGHEQLREVIYSRVNAGIVGRSQHSVGGPPASFRLIDENVAIMVTYSIVFAKDANHFTPLVQYQNHAMNRWTFRRVESKWYIAENIRRRMGSPDSAELFEDF